MAKIDIKPFMPKIEKLAMEHGLSFVVLFGSQAVGNIHDKSDVDIAVISRQDIDKMRITEDLSNILGRDDIEIVNLAHASPSLMHCVVKDGVLLYEKEKGEFMNWKLYAIWVWLDTAWLRELRNKKLVEWAKNA